MVDLEELWQTLLTSSSHTENYGEGRIVNLVPQTSRSLSPLLPPAHQDDALLATQIELSSVIIHDLVPGRLL